MGEPFVNMQTFLTAVQTRLVDSVSGYCCCIGDTTSRLPPISGGQAQPGAGFSESTQHGIASCAKTLTAAAALQLLDPAVDPAQGGKPKNALGLNLDSPMYHALPTDWNLNAAFTNITFRDLLAHTSGLPPENSKDEPGQDWKSLKTYLTQKSNPPKPALLPEPPPPTPGNPPPPPGTPVPKAPYYSNFAYALFRILLPNLNGSKDVGNPTGDSAVEEQRAQNYANGYRNIVLDKVFGAVNVTGPDTQPLGNYEWEFPYPGGAGWDPATGTGGYDTPYPLWTGSGCWWMSMDQIAPALASLSNSAAGNGILSPDQWLHMQGIPTWPDSIPADMVNLPLGLDSVKPVTDPSGNKYRFVWKNGQGLYTTTAVAFFGSSGPPSNGPYYAALFANSPIGTGPSESGWDWCSKCETLFYDGDTQGVCPDGGSHSAGGQYILLKSAVSPSAAGWKRCGNCQALTYDFVTAPHPSPPQGPPHGGGHTVMSVPVMPHPPSVCPATGGSHQCPPDQIFLLNEQGADPSVSQGGWRSCEKCGVLAFSGNGPGVCAADTWHRFAQKGHNYGAQDYWLWFPAEQEEIQNVLANAFLEAIGK